MSAYLCVDQLPATVTSADLVRLLGDHSGIRRCMVATGMTGASLGFAFIETVSMRDADRIVETLDGVRIHGRTVRVSRMESELVGAGLE